MLEVVAILALLKVGGVVLLRAVLDFVYLVEDFLFVAL